MPSLHEQKDPHGQLKQWTRADWLNGQQPGCWLGALKIIDAKGDGRPAVNVRPVHDAGSVVWFSSSEVRCVCGA